MSVELSGLLLARRGRRMAIASEMAKIIAPPPDRDAGQWADAHRSLPIGSPEPGPWRTDRVPFWRAIYRAFADDTHDTVVVVCGAQMGKALALDTPLVTPSGWTTMGAVRVGDWLFDDSGQPCRVTDKSPIYTDHDCYRLTFCDGEQIIADAGHRWVVRDNKRRMRTLTTQQIAESAPKQSHCYRIAVAQPLRTEAADLPVDPYVLGAWLGDGNSLSAIVTCDERDGVKDNLESVLGPLTFRRDSRRPHILQVHLGRSTMGTRKTRCGRGHDKVLYRGKYQCRECARLHAEARRRGRKLPCSAMPKGDGMHARLAGMGLIGDKHIPAQYLRASESQRWALLQGLMDTDGTAGENGSYVFTCCNGILTDQVRELMTSLGLKPTSTWREAKLNGRNVGIAYIVRGTTYADVPLFRLARKQHRLKSRHDPRSRPTESEGRSIRKIEKIAPVAVQCVSVDSPSRLYLAGRSMIATHNTESLFNLIGHRFTDGPFAPAIYVGPTEKQVRSMSKDRIDKMLRSTPVLWERTERGHRYGAFEKFIAGVRLGFAWAGSATELASHPAGLIVIDERDRMAASTGDEGDPVELARARTKNYPQRKIVVTSTPTLEGASPIWQLWEEGTMQMWAWPCLGCARFFVPTIERLRWDKERIEPATGEVTTLAPEDAAMTARVECPHCGRSHGTADRDRMNALGCYLPHRRMGERERSEHAIFGLYVQASGESLRMTASFWVSGLASPWPSFESSALKLIQAYRSQEPERLQAVINTEFGELFRVRGEAPDWSEVSACRGEYPPALIVPGIQKLTMGADVQRDGIYYVVRGWGYNSESWLLDAGYLAGETDHDAVWVSLRNVIQSPIRDRRIERAFIDSGYRPGDVHRRPDHAVYTFCRSLPGVAYPTKGQDAMDTPYLFRAIDYTHGGALIKGGVKLCHINTDYFKRWLHSRIRWPLGQPGGWHLHNETTEDYCRQMVAEELVLKPSGRATWIRRSRSNHYLDAEVNATAAAYSINVHKLAPVAEAPSLPPTPAAAKVTPPPLPPPPPDRYQRRKLF